MPAVIYEDSPNTPEDSGAWYLARYTCPGCGHGWEAEYSCVTDDECPECGARDIEAETWRQC